MAMRNRKTATEATGELVKEEQGEGSSGGAKGL